MDGISPIIKLKLHAKQKECFLSEATEILYGGAAGGGKSHAMRIIAIAFAFAVPKIQIYLFRRVFADLIKNHMEGPSGFRTLLAPWVKTKHVRITDDEITFWNGAKIYLCHCQHEKDRFKYQGAEMNLLLIDELTHFTETIYKFLRSRARLGSLEVPEQYKHKLPLILAGSNPGGIGHSFVKRYFIDGAAPMTVRKMPDEEGGMLRQFIPAKLIDNPTMQENDPLYASKLMGLGGALAKAMLDGDWNAIEGAYFDKFSYEKHVIEPFEIPAKWYRIRAFDWGYAKPFSVGWYAVSDGIERNGIWLPKGAMIKYREWYGCQKGKDNVGIGLTNEEIAKGILKREENEKINDMVADPAIFAHNGGVSIAEQMQKCGVFFRSADNERVNGWQQIRNRLVGQEDLPMLYFFETCYDTIRTLPVLMHDETKPEDVDSDMEDHAADETRYACMSRPLTITQELIKKRDPNKIYVADLIGMARNQNTEREYVF